MNEDKKKEPEEVGIVPVPADDEHEQVVPSPEEAAAPPTEKKTEGKESGQQPRQTIGQIVRSMVLAFLRLIILVAVITGCGAALYFGVPFLYANFVRPVEENTSQMNDLKSEQSQIQTHITDLQTRVATLEAGQTTQSDALTERDTRLQLLETGMADQSDLTTDLDSRLQVLEGADADRNDSFIELTYQSDLLRAMELLSRARLFLYQSNFGLARIDVQAARDVLAELQTIAPDARQQDLDEAILRLDLALGNLPNFPVAASVDLDLAWQILLDGYPVAPTATPTPSSTSTPVVTATPVPELIETPTPTP